MAALSGEAHATSASGSKPRTRAPFDHRAFLVGLVVVCGYVALAALVFWPVGPLDASRLPGGSIGDPDELTWFLAWTPYAIAHGHNIFLTHAIDLPGGVNLADNTSMPLLGLLASPITALFGPIAAYNLLLRLALAASAASAYFVLRRYCRGEIGPAIGGLLYGFSPAITSHLGSSGHLDLVFVPLPPLLFLLLDEVFVRQRRSPWLAGALGGAIAAAQYLISAELFADCVVLAVLGVAALAISHPGEIRVRLGYVWRALLGGGAVFALVAGYPIALLLAGPGHLSGPVQATAHLQRFRTDLLEPVIPDARQWFEPSGLLQLSARILEPVRRAGGGAELGGYLGVPLLVVVLLLALRLRRSGVVRLACWLGFAAFVCSLGSRLQVDGHSTWLPLPEALLAKLPLLDSTVPARFALFVVLFLALVVAVGADDVVTSARDGTAQGRLSLVLCGFGVACTLLALAPRLPVSDEQPALPGGTVTALHDLVAPGAIVLSYPYPEPPFAQAMLWQASDDFAFRLLGGYATVRNQSGKAQLFAPLGEPAYVQEFLGRAEAGAHSHYPAPAASRDPEQLLCSYLARTKTSVVLYSPYGQFGSEVLDLFTRALGPPERTLDGLSVWRLSEHPCSAGGSVVGNSPPSR